MAEGTGLAETSGKGCCPGSGAQVRLEIMNRPGWLQQYSLDQGQQMVDSPQGWCVPRRRKAPRAEEEGRARKVVNRARGLQGCILQESVA